jgi:hypothetical protein
MPTSSNSYRATALLFIAGGLVTAAFSGSLHEITRDVSLTEVLVVGLVVPSFTWLVQLAAAALGLEDTQRRLYCSDLAWVCFVGSVALLPAAMANFWLVDAPLAFSVMNVVGSVLLMAALIFLRAIQHGLSPIWPMSWCVCIAMNMTLFAWISRRWWA